MRGRKRSWILAATAVVMTVAGVAVAGNRFMKPGTRVEVTHRMGKIIRTNTGTPRHDAVVSDVVIDASCPKNYHLHQIALTTPFTEKHHPIVIVPTKMARSWKGATFKAVKLATAEQVEKRCGTGAAAMFNVTLKSNTLCQRHNLTNTLNDFDKMKKTQTVTIKVNCDRNLIRAKTRGVRFRHDCPTGYSIKGKGKQSVTNSRRAPEVCVRNGYNYSPACPFIYLEDPNTRQQVRHGEIIANLVGKALESEHAQAIPEHFVKDDKLTVTIREEKDEISHVDYLALRAGDQLLLPTQPRAALRKRDEHYHVMHKGDALTVTFDLKGIVDRSDMELVSAGYYDIIDAAD